MRITEEIAQPIVDRLRETIDTPINIIDCDGIIVASTEQRRIGTFHQGSLIALRRKQDLVVYESQMRDLPGTRVGITMPLPLSGEYIGALGISGNPDKISEIAPIIRVAVLSLAEQAYQSQKRFTLRRLHDTWASRLIAERLADPDALAEQARELDIDLARSCSLIIVGFYPIAHTEIVTTERPIVQIIASYCKLHFNAYIGQGHYLFAIPAHEGVDETWLTRMCADIQSHLALWHQDFNICVGRPGAGLEGYRASYFDALQSMHIMERLQMRDEVLYYFQHRVFRLLEYIPQSARTAFCESFLKNSALDGQLGETLAAYFDAHCSPVLTAKALHIHRNTLTYRLAKVKELSGLDPRNFRDAVTLQIILFLLRAPQGGTA